MQVEGYGKDSSGGVDEKKAISQYRLNTCSFAINHPNANAKSLIIYFIVIFLFINVSKLLPRTAILKRWVKEIL